MDYKKKDFINLIGRKFDDQSFDPELYTIEKNTFELELEEGIPIRWFVKSADETIKMILNKDKIIETIVFFPDSENRFPIFEFHTEIGRNEIREKMGKPDKEALPSNIPILGHNCGFDRFDKEISYHFEYSNDEQTRLKKITLMDIRIAP